MPHVPTAVTTTYLHLLSPTAIRHSTPNPDVQIVRSAIPSPELSRFLYATVGGDWFWLGRLSWTRDQWADYLSRPMVETWIAYLQGTPTGYIELSGESTSDQTEVEIAYFGLMPGFLGRGIGGHLLSHGLDRAWDLPTRWPDAPPVSRVWVHTCTLDGPAALANYQARGMTVYKTETATETLPERSPGAWPGP